MNMKIHAIALALIVGLIVIIATYNKDTVQPVATSKYYIEIANASYGLNCNRRPSATTLPADPVYQRREVIQPNNVLEAVSQLCNTKPTCAFKVEPQTLGVDPMSTCEKMLDVEYRCFSYDRPWKVRAPDYDTLSIDCTTRGDD